MSEWEIVLIAGCIVLTTFTVEGIAGFGATVMALPFITMLVGIDKAVPMLSSLSVLLSLFIISRSWKNFVWKEYLFIVLHVGLGVPVGLFMMDHLPKAGLIGMTKSLALYGAKCGIRSVAIAPGPVMTRPAMAKMPTPMGRAAEVIEVVDLILYLCSDKASYISGTVISIDGARSCGGSY